MSLRDISKSISVGNVTIFEFMRDNDIPLRSKSESLVLKKGVLCKLDATKVRKLYCDRQLAPREIAKLSSVSKSSINRFLVNEGISLRDSKQANQLRRTPLCFSVKDSDLGYMLGVLFGDGSLDKRSFALGVKDLSFVRRFKACAVNLGFEKVRIIKAREGIFRARINSVAFVEMLRMLHFEDLNHAQKMSFVEGFFDSEGCVCYNVYGGRIAKSIRAFNTSVKKLRAISKFLKSEGIEVSLTLQHKGEGHFGTKAVYLINIIGKESYRLFCKYFTLFGRKQKKLNAIRRCIG